MFQITDVQIIFILIFIITFYHVYSSLSFIKKNVGLIFISFIQGLLLSVIFPNLVLITPIMALFYYLLFYKIRRIISKYFISNKLEPYNDETLIQSLNKFPEISHLKFKFYKDSGDNPLNAYVNNTFSNEYQISFGDEIISKFSLEEKIIVSVHEIGHIFKKHIGVKGISVVTVLIIGFGLVLSGFNSIVLTYLENYLVYFYCAITLIELLVGIIVINTISWRNEYDADKMTIQLTKDITNLESAYLKLDENHHNKDYGIIINLLVYSHPLFINRIKRTKETYKSNMMDGALYER